MVSYGPLEACEPRSTNHSRILPISFKTRIMEQFSKESSEMPTVIERQRKETIFERCCNEEKTINSHISNF